MQRVLRYFKGLWPFQKSNIYRKSSKETRRPEGLNVVLIRIWYFCLLFFKVSVGFIRMRVLFEGGSLSKIFGEIGFL